MGHTHYLQDFVHMKHPCEASGIDMAMSVIVLLAAVIRFYYLPILRALTVWGHYQILMMNKQMGFKNIRATMI